MQAGIKTVAGHSGKKHAPGQSRPGLSQAAHAYQCSINRRYLSSVDPHECKVLIDNIARTAKGLSDRAMESVMPRNPHPSITTVSGFTSTVSGSRDAQKFLERWR